MDLGFGTDRWDAAFYSAMALVSKASEAVRSAHSTVAIPARLWVLERQLRAFSDALQVPTNRLREAKLGPIDIGEPGRAFVERLYSLSNSAQSLYNTARSKGLTNRTLTAGSLNSINRVALAILNAAEFIDMASDPQTEESFRIAHEEFRRGECVGLEAIR